MGRLGWPVSEIGYGMWGMGGWTGSDDDESARRARSRRRARLQLLRHRMGVRRGQERTTARRAAATLIRTSAYIALQGASQEHEVARPRRLVPRRHVPADHIREYTEKSLENLGGERWISAVPRRGTTRGRDDASGSGRCGAQGGAASFAPSGSASIAGSRRTAARARTGLIDAVQVVYNIFDQAPEDEMFPACRERGIGVIARVPFDEGSLTGTLTRDRTGPKGTSATCISHPRTSKPSTELNDSRPPCQADQTCRRSRCALSSVTRP